MHHFEYYGEVRGQMRPRTGRFSVYKDKKDKEYERAIRDAYINSGGKHFGDKPLYLEIHAYRALPKSTPRYVESEPDIHKPDGSNILKSVEDALNGIAYDDDRQIVDARVIKMPRTRCREHLEIEIGHV